MVLFYHFRPTIEAGHLVILYAHSGVSTGVRSEYTTYFQRNCQQGDPVKVLISTINIFGEGHNMQRVNSCILTEVPNTHERQKQAFGRVDRTGQTMTPLLFQLFDRENRCERIKMQRNINQRNLAAAGQGRDNDEDLMQILFGDSGDGDG
ncbi:hypothetical protein F4678DRAFT_439591 [Xylaria arbuscula]|nr:hypothetical protein F4678DRAFT_439591 [Xylaria arbuscula]